MGYMTVKFIDKEYTIPEDVLTYIDLLDFTDNVQKQLMRAFHSKLNLENGFISDKDLADEMNQQAGAFIAKLCEYDIYNRTVNDYLKDNKGYQLFSDVNKAAFEKMKDLLSQEIDSWQAGFEDALYKKESSITGMGFSIWSGSFVNHAIYAAMQASTLNKQEKEASEQYRKDMDALQSRLDKQYGGEKMRYISDVYVPHIEVALTAFAYELLDRYIADLIASQKFDAKTLEYVDIGRSNDLLQNLTLSGNKKAILENAFVACPYNLAVYGNALKHELLDYETFQTAKLFKQGEKIVSFLEENFGEIAYPTKFKINYYCADLLALFTEEQSADLLRSRTEFYVGGIVKAYARIAEMISDKSRCRNIMSELEDEEILAGEAISKEKAHSYVDSIVTTEVWNQLTGRCGHTDLLDRIKKCISSPVDASTKAEFDKYLVEQLFAVFASERRVLAAKIEKQREAEIARKAEQEQQEKERRKRNKKIAAIVTPIIAVAIVFVIVLNTVIIPSSKYNKAASLQETGDYYAAIELYNDLGDYKDVNSRCVDLWGKITVRDTISAGYGHTVTLKENGTVIATGDDRYGRTDVSDWTDIIAISAGINYTLGLKSDGTVLAVGADNDGKCEIESWRNIVAISAGMDHSVGLKSDGTVIAVGLNKDDQCEVSGWSNIIAIAAGDNHTVGLKSDGTVVAAGGSEYGSCDVADWTDIVAISAASAYTIGLKADGTVVVAESEHSYVEERVEDWFDIVAISADNDHVVGLKADGTVVAAGDNDDGQCIVSGWNNIVAVATGYYHTVGLKSDGTVVVTGSNEYGQCNVSNWKDIKLPSNEDSPNGTGASSIDMDYDEDLTWYNVEFASSFLGKELNADGSLSMGPGDYEAISNDMYLFDIAGRFSHGMSSADTEPVIVDILDWVTTASIDNFNNTKL